VTPLTSLPEIGPVTARLLTAVGLPDAESLRAAGTREAFRRIREQADPGACIQLLYGLEGAVEGVPASRLAPDVKVDLRAWFRSLPDASG